jgi:hypothetical protein
VVLCGEDEECVHRMWSILSEELAKITLSWKPGSLELLVAGHSFLPDEPPCSWAAGGAQVVVACRNRLVFLGCCINSTACPVVMAEHRVAQAWVHFWSRRSQFCARRIPLRLRWARLHETVVPTLLYLAGVWGWYKPAANLVSVAYNKMLLYTLCRRRFVLDPPGDFIHRMRAKLQELRIIWPALHR